MSAKTKVKLSTPIGKWIENLTYRSIIGYMTLVIALSSLYFCLACPFEEGLANCAGPIKKISFLNSIYFNIITFSSLGYGDLAPIGFGRIIASCEVILGLMLVALFVGKVASERQSAILLLLYTSENQRRIQEFSKGIDNIAEQMDTALTNHDHKKLSHYGRQAVRLVASTSSYLSFQSKEGGLTNFGNVSTLRALYQSVVNIQMIAINALKIRDTENNIRNTLEQLNERAIGISVGMSPFHIQDFKATAQLNHIQRQYNDYKNWQKLFQEGRVLMQHRSVITEPLLETVLKSLPKHPWPKNIQKETAQKVGISNKLAQKCIEELIKRNHWPNYKNENTDK